VEDLIVFIKDPAVYEIVAGITTQMLAFLLFAWILKKFAWKPVMKILDERQKKIKDDLKRADEYEKAFIKLKAQYEEKIKHIDEEAHEKMSEAIREGKHIAQEIVNHARQEALISIRKGRKHVEIELEKAREQIKKEVTGLVIKATEKLLTAELNNETHHKLVASFIDEVERRK